MIIMEIESKHDELEYLSEYLIESKGITLQEAKYLITLIEDEKQNADKKIKERAKKRLTKLNNWLKKQKETLKNKYEGTKLAKKLADAAEKYRVQKGYIHMDMQKGGSANLTKAKRAKAAVKAVYKTFPKTTKYGTAAAGTAAALGGLAVYSAKKKRKEALKK